MVGNRQEKIYQNSISTKKSTLSGYLEISKKKTRDAPKEMISNIMRCYSIQL